MTWFLFFAALLVQSAFSFWLGWTAAQHQAVSVAMAELDRRIDALTKEGDGC